jgi:excisionase family DNA binding protein
MDDNSEARQTTVQPMLVSVEDAARLLSVGRSTVYELIARGELLTINILRSRRVPIEALRTFIEERQTALY